MLSIAVAKALADIVVVHGTRDSLLAIVHVVLDGCRGGSIDIEAVAGRESHGADQCRRVDGVHRVSLQLESRFFFISYSFNCF